MEEVNKVRELVTQLRALKAERNQSNNREAEFFFLGNGEDNVTIHANENSILSMVGAVALKQSDEAPTGLPASVTPLGTFFLDLSAGVDLDAERQRLNKEIESLQGIIRGIESKLNNKSFVDKAPPQVVEGARKQLQDNVSKLGETQDALKSLQ